MLSFFLALSLLAASGNSTPFNVTIDDEFGDEMTGAMPIYSPAGEWEQGLTCLLSCDINILEVPLDISQIYQATWHEATHQFGRLGDQTTITVSFTGSAVYVYHIVLNTVPDSEVITLTQLSFFLDGQVVGNYSHTPDSSDTILYNVPVFVSTGLANAAHTLVISGEGRKSLLLFDYVMYTSEDGSGEGGGFPSSSSIPSSTSVPQSALPSTPTLVSIHSDTSTSYLPSTSLLSSSIQNLSSTPSQTSSQSITSTTHALQTNTSSLPPTTTSSAQRTARQNNHVSTRAMVGATVGSIAALLLVCALLFWHIRRRNRGQGVHVTALPVHMHNGNEPATPVDDNDDATELKTDSVLEIKRLSPIWKPLVPLPPRSYLTSSRRASSGAAVTTVDAYGHSSEGGPDVRPRNGISARGLRKDIMEIREQLARLRARRGRL